MKFPEADHPGVEAIAPDLSFLDECGTVHAVLLSHGHDDHVGAVPFLLSRRDVPIYSPPHARSLVLRRLSEHAELDGAELRLFPEDGSPLRLGPFRIGTLPVAHSIPQSKMLVVNTPAGVVLHTADYKLEGHGPNGQRTDMAALSELGRQGVLALFGDSTNADRPGTTPPESVAARGLTKLIEQAPERVLVACFASHVERMQALVRIAQSAGRRIALVGTSLQAHTEVAERLGLLHFPRGLRVAPEQVRSLPRGQALIVASGSQAERASAFARVAAGTHRDVGLDPGDRVIHSARVIPGNEPNIRRAVNRFIENGVEVFTAADAPVHVSGHASGGELLRLLETVRPSSVVPIHGDHRQLHAHAALARQSGLSPSRVVVARSGDVVALSSREARVVDRVAVGPVFLAGRLQAMDPLVLRERRRMADEGVIVVVVAAEAGGKAFRVLNFEARGVVGLPEDWTDEAGRVIIEELGQLRAAERSDPDTVQWRIGGRLRRHLRRRCDSRPLIVPMLVGGPWDPRRA